MNIYPNPSDGTVYLLNIHSSHAKPTQLKVLNLQGQEILQMIVNRFNNQEVKVDLVDLPSTHS